ncbi:hypothetical protein HPB48_018329 [Haemaphysalis longicornis]|uniref:tetrahydrofolate synthase n=1 Tax=Haemaphysalis longicornis TaxID=44386 RepID=A0A9J6F6X1_HAELO|nr:hypothetical protein HPB48_018329 [Haemaphysalis longicornis]
MWARQLMRVCPGLAQMADIDNLKIIHVAGTKGKGSTCAFAESILRHHGFKTGLYTHPSVVGITSLGLDHTRLLGSSVQEIAWQKAGILKRGCPAFSLPQPDRGLEVLWERARERGCTITLAPPLQTYEWDVPHCRLGIPGEPQLANASLALQLCKTWLAKHCSRASAASKKQATKEAAERVWFERHHLPVIARPFSITKLMAKGLEQCRWPGRCQVVPAGPGLTLYLDGAHTEDSINCCVRWWREAAASEQQALGTKVQVRRMLLFNCIGDRRPEILLSYLADELFHTALFTPNRLTIDKSPYSGGETPSLPLRESAVNRDLEGLKADCNDAPFASF